jgi:hypothetical protein
MHHASKEQYLCNNHSRNRMRLSEPAKEHTHEYLMQRTRVAATRTFTETKRGLTEESKLEERNAEEVEEEFKHK